MLSFPNAKINLGLNITRKRQDGYHNLETVFYPVNIKDALEIILSPQFDFTSTGLPIEGDAENNLCIKAYWLLQKDFPQLPFVNIHLHKVIPMGAGLGGGSADGAFMLKLLNEKFHLNIAEERLLDYALQLGSDCPFFILNEPCFATGRGENLEAAELDLSAYQFVIVSPQIHVSTKAAFSQLTPAIPSKPLRQIIHQPIATWKDELKNDFEKPVFSAYPVIAKIKQQLYDAGAVYSCMSGSGSSVYGIFEKEGFTKPLFPVDYKVFCC